VDHEAAQDAGPEIHQFVDNQASIQTRRMYRSDVEDLARFVAGRGRKLHEALREDLVGWFRSLEKREVRGKQGLDGATLARKLSVIKTFFEFLREKGTIEAFATVRSGCSSSDKASGSPKWPSSRSAISRRRTGTPSSDLRGRAGRS